jgi:hypothetical protein
LENLDEDGRITFNQFNIYGVCVWTAFNWLGFFEHNSEPLGLQKKKTENCSTSWATTIFSRTVLRDFSDILQIKPTWYTYTTICNKVRRDKDMWVHSETHPSREKRIPSPVALLVLHAVLWAKSNLRAVHASLPRFSQH